jgi:hypothetical protein
LCGREQSKDAQALLVVQPVDDVGHISRMLCDKELAQSGQIVGTQGFAYLLFKGIKRHYRPPAHRASSPIWSFGAAPAPCTAICFIVSIARTS